MFGPCKFKLILLISYLCIKGSLQKEVTDGKVSCQFPEYFLKGKNTWQIGPVFEDKSTIKDLKEVWHVAEDRKSIMVEQFVKKEPTFFQDRIIYDVEEKSDAQYTMLCHEKSSKEDESVFLVKKTNQQKTTYRCFSFVKRSDLVITLKISNEFEKQGIEKCHDGIMFNSPSFLIYFEIEFGSYQNLDVLLSRSGYQECPLEGSYSIVSVFDSRTNKTWRGEGLSSKYYTQTISNECERGKGMLIFSPLTSDNQTRIEMYPRVVFCLASWTYEGSTFMILGGTESFDKGSFYCMQYHGVQGKPTDGFLYIYNNTMCNYEEDKSDFYHSLRSFTKLEVTQDDNSNSDLCSDKEKNCDSITPGECKNRLLYTCSKSCQGCPDKKPWLDANFNTIYQHEYFRDSLKRRNEHVVINSKELILPNWGTFDVLGENICRYEKTDEYGSFKDPTTYMVMQKGTTDGCAPRLSIVALKEITSSVVLLKLAKGVEYTMSSVMSYDETNKKWSLPNGKCNFMYFSSNSFKPLENVYHHSNEAWDVLIKKEEDHTHQPCVHLLKPEFRFTLPSGEHCSATIKPTEKNTTFEFTIDDCNQESDKVKDYIGKTSTIECLAVLHGEKEKEGNFIITKTTKGGANVLDLEYFCWYLNDPNGEFWAPFGNCYPYLGQDIRYYSREPLANVYNTASSFSGEAFRRFTSAIVALAILALIY